MAQIFVSYANEDRDRVQGLVQVLEASGLSVFWDREIPPGQSWRDVLDRELVEAQRIVVVWSKHSIESRWVCEEAEDARNRGIFVPVLLDGVIPPLGFREVQASNLTHWEGSPDDPPVLQLLTALDGKPRTSSGSLTPATQHRLPAAPSSKRWLGALVVALAAIGIAGYFVVRAPKTAIVTKSESAARPIESAAMAAALEVSPADSPAKSGNASVRSNRSRRSFHEDFMHKEDLAKDIWILGAKSDWDGQVVGGSYRLCNKSGSDTASWTRLFTNLDIDNAADAADARVTMNVRLEGARSKNSAAGIAYRAVRPDGFYAVFALGSGHSVVLVKNYVGGRIKIEGTWELSAVRDNDAVSLRVEGEGPVTRLFANDKLVFTDSESKPHGRPGVYATGRGCFVFDDVNVQLPE